MVYVSLRNTLVMPVSITMSAVTYENQYARIKPVHVMEVLCQQQMENHVFLTLVMPVSITMSAVTYENQYARIKPVHVMEVLCQQQMENHVFLELVMLVHQMMIVTWILIFTVQQCNVLQECVHVSHVTIHPLIFSIVWREVSPST
ncbi:hypothetical protein C0J52_21563 [Blattella germanica]|nr:hypothetical protein C0J52_21563 [Blattella germanica]